MAIFERHRVRNALGLGRAMAVSIVGMSASPLLLLIPRNAGLVAILVLFAGWLGHGGGISIWNVNTITLRQALTPMRVQARMNATYRMLLSGALPVGALLGDALGNARRAEQCHRTAIRAGDLGAHTGLPDAVAVFLAGVSGSPRYRPLGPLSATSPTPGSPAPIPPGPPRQVRKMKRLMTETAQPHPVAVPPDALNSGRRVLVQAAWR
jgi:hypothetical protein